MTVSGHIIAADRFVVNSTTPWPDWEKVLLPDERDLADHPWYHLYLERSGEGRRNNNLEDNKDEHLTALSPSERSCHTCVSRGIPCDLQPGRACLQCKKSKIRCSHVVQAKAAKRGGSVSRPPPVAEHACKPTMPTVHVHDLSFSPTEGYCECFLPLLV